MSKTPKKRGRKPGPLTPHEGTCPTCKQTFTYLGDWGEITAKMIEIWGCGPCGVERRRRLEKTAIKG